MERGELFFFLFFGGSLFRGFLGRLLLATVIPLGITVIIAVAVVGATVVTTAIAVALVLLFLLFLNRTDQTIAFVVVVLHAVLVELNGQEANDSLVATQSQFGTGNNISSVGLELDAKVNTRRTPVDRVRQLAEPHLINVNDGTTFVLQMINVCLSCRFDLFPGQHWVYDDSYFVLIHGSDMCVNK